MRIKVRKANAGKQQQKFTLKWKRKMNKNVKMEFTSLFSVILYYTQPSLNVMEKKIVPAKMVKKSEWNNGALHSYRYPLPLQSSCFFLTIKWWMTFFF